MVEFYLEDYMQTEQKNLDFNSVCETIQLAFDKEWTSEKNPEKFLELQKRAITGCAPEVEYFKLKILECLKECELENTQFPKWYNNLTEAVFHENWGVAAIAEWFTEKYKESSSAKIIGDRVYFMENGQMVLKPQKISQKRREQLIRSFLLLTPGERMDKDFHEVYLLDGTRVTIFKREMVKKGQDVIIFRRYIVPSYTFEEQAMRGTIPVDSIKLFEAMARLGYNVAFCGAVRTAKSTFLSTWQSYENPELEGVMVETDPEIPMHKLMPQAPVVQLIADGEKLSSVTKNLLRSDADYFIMAEARDGIALDTVLRIAAKGTRRLKITFHTGNPLSFAQDVAVEVVNSLGGSFEFTARRAAAAFDYIFSFVQLADKSKKRLKSIYEQRLDDESGEIKMMPVCEYDFEKDKWIWHFNISEEKRRIGVQEDAGLYMRFESELRRLSRDKKRGDERKNEDNI